MRIGIDVSQAAYEGTGVGNYIRQLVTHLVEHDKKHDYVLFFSSLRRPVPNSILKLGAQSNVTIKTFRFPPLLLDFLWNTAHIVPVEWLIGHIDVFLSSDWTQPPTKAKKMTILYDLIVYTYPHETAKKIIDVQHQKLKWVKKECDKILCISEATKKDAQKILGIPERRLSVVYPGM